MTVTRTIYRQATRVLLGAALAVCAGLSGGAASPTANAPDFTLRTADGRNLRLQELRGQVVMVNFWASWCAPCRVEMPHLNKLSDKYRSSGFTLLGVNVDDDPRNATSAATEGSAHARMKSAARVSGDPAEKVARSKTASE